MERKTVVLTFDDAVSNHASFVAPLLVELGFHATFFLCEFPPDFAVNKRQYMTWEEIRSLDAAGFETANHTLTHAGLGEIGPAECEREIEALEARFRDGQYAHEDVPLVPQNRVRLEVGVWLVEDLEVKGGCRYVSSQVLAGDFENAQDRLAGYTLFDVGVYYSPVWAEGWKASFVMDNLFDRQVIDVVQYLSRLPKGTEHFMSDLHGEHEAFLHILNNASGVIREKIDAVLGKTVSAHERAELATLIYYPVQKLPELKAHQQDLDSWYRRTLLQLIELCRLVSSKHTRAHVRKCLPASCGYILDELLHAHFEDHDKDLYYGEIIDSILRYDRADAYIIRFCEVIKHLAVDRLHILGDMYDRGPRPDLIMDQLMEHHDVDIQWGNHDVVWMGAAAGSAVCIFTVLKTSLAYGNIDLIETGYGISLRALERFAVDFYPGDIDKRWLPHPDERAVPNQAALVRNARMHKAVTLLLFKLEAQVIARNPDFRMAGRDYLNQIDYAAGTVRCGGKTYPMLECDFPTVDPADPTALTAREQELTGELCRAFMQSERLQRHIRFLYARGAVYKVFNGNLLFHGAVPMTADGAFAPECFEGREYSGKALFDYCDRRARQGYFAPPGSAERTAGQDFLWYLWCGSLSPIFGRSAMTAIATANVCSVNGTGPNGTVTHAHTMMMAMHNATCAIERVRDAAGDFFANTISPPSPKDYRRAIVGNDGAQVGDDSCLGDNREASTPRRLDDGSSTRSFAKDMTPHPVFPNAATPPRLSKAARPRNSEPGPSRGGPGSQCWRWQRGRTGAPRAERL